MAEKKFLSLAGLTHFQEKNKKYIDDADAATLQSAKDYTDGKIGTLGEGLTTVAAAIAGEKALREAADTAINDNLGVASKAAVGVEGQEGYQAAVTATGLNAKVETLEAAIGENGSVATQIKTAIEALDKDDTAVAGQFVTAVSETDGKITVSRAALAAADIPDLTLAKITDSGTAAAATVATVAIGTENETEGALPTVAQVKSYVASEVADLTGAMHFRNVVTDLASVTNPKAGDVAIVGTKEYVYTDGGEWKELGDEGTHVTKSFTIAGVDMQDNITADEMKTALDVDDLETAVGTATVKNGDTVTAAATGLFKRVEDLEAVNAAADTYVAITDNEIDALFAPATTENAGA